jgi:nucleotide-binding universal stress UspA family protein
VVGTAAVEVSSYGQMNWQTRTNGPSTPERRVASVQPCRASYPLIPKPVVVGVDGSTASLNALRWAVAEAVNRDIPLRLVHAVPDVKPQMAPPACCSDEVLLGAEDEIRGRAKALRFECARVAGEAGEVLVRESANAVMICVGAPSPVRSAGRLFGSTTTTLAKHAYCPVAIIRSEADGSMRDGGVVSVVLNDDPDNDAVVHCAMEEGRLRNAMVRQIDRRVDSWIRRYPDVPVEIVAAGTGRRYRRLGGDDGGIQLAVVGDSDANDITTLALPNCHPILGYPGCSVLLVRN